MNAYIAYAIGSPCPTLVIDASELPQGYNERVDALARIRAELVARGHADVLKFALVAPARNPRFDIEYTFVQCMPGIPDRFDAGGSCGHSILCSIMVARRLDWLGRLAPGALIRVSVLNTGDSVVCEVEAAAWPHVGFTAHFMPTETTRLGDALLTREPVTAIALAGRDVPVSIASVSNAYAFVDAATLGVHSQRELFFAGPELYVKAVALRAGYRTARFPGRRSVPEARLARPIRVRPSGRARTQRAMLAPDLRADRRHLPWGRDRDRAQHPVRLGAPRRGDARLGDDPDARLDDRRDSRGDGHLARRASGLGERSGQAGPFRQARELRRTVRRV